MKALRYLVLATLYVIMGFHSNGFAQSAADQESLKKTTDAIRAAFASGDAAAAVALHHPDVMKWFGGDNVVRDRKDLEKGLTAMFQNSRMEFIENITESIVFNGETAIETSIFTIKATPKNGGEPTISRGRAMVVYIRHKDSPTGWLSLREMAQAPPSK